MSHAHEALDGERPRTSLSPDERAHAIELEQAVDEAVAPIKAAPAPDLTANVMARLRAAGPLPVVTRVTERPSFWRALLWEPRVVTLRVRPALAAAAAFAALLPLVLFDQAQAPLDQPGAALVAERGTPDDVGVLYMRFRLDSPDARSVALAGSFTNWSPRYQLRESAPGVWSVTVPLAPGVHEYGFLVDGERWTPDPLAAQVADGFGGSNSQLAILPSGEAL